MEKLLNIFGEPDDMRGALYSCWADAEDARCALLELRARYHFNSELKTELDSILQKIEGCGKSVRIWAPNYHRETLEGWALGALELNHP